MENVYLWSASDRIKICDEFRFNNNTIKKICNINNHLYLLASDKCLYHGYVEASIETDEKYLNKIEKYTEHIIKDVDSCNHYVYIVDIKGKALQLTQDLKIHKEYVLIDEPKCCIHGHKICESNLKIHNVAAGNFGVLLVTTNGELWACGYMPQIGIESNEPKKVKWSDGRIVHSVSVGYDFAVALLSKDLRVYDTDSEECNGDVFVSTCPLCTSGLQISTASSQNSLSPLELSLEKSSSISILSSGRDALECSDSEKIQESTAETCNNKTEKNIIFRNTEAAKEFLTRQFSWVSVGEEYLAECTEKPTRIIKENVTNMANLVYEGVNTVRDKVVTLSRHVSGSSDNNEAIEKEEPLSQSITSSLPAASSSQCSSEKEHPHQNVRERCDELAKSGSILVGTEVWTWGRSSHGQLGTGDTIKRDKPVLISKLTNIGVRKIHSGWLHVAAITWDGRVFLWGRNEQHQVSTNGDVDVSAPKLLRDSKSNDVACGNEHTVILMKNELKYLGKLTITESPSHGLIKLTSVSDSTRIKLTTSCYYTCLSGEQINNNDEISELESKIVEATDSEQSFLENLLNKVPETMSVQNEKNVSVHENLRRRREELIWLTTLNVRSMVEYCEGNASILEIVVMKRAAELATSYTDFSKAVCDAISSGELSNDDRSKWERPLRRLSAYATIVRMINKTATAVGIWQNLAGDQDKLLLEAENTKKFWEENGKTGDALRIPNRRLLRDGRTHPLQLQGAGRFSSHWFALLSDVLVHVNGNVWTSHSLDTLWVEPASEGNGITLRLTTPEEVLIVSAATPEERSEWLRCLRNAVGRGATRSARYRFVRAGPLKDTRYSGRWLDGKMHGRGRIRWPDGRIYVGTFYDGRMHGRGRIEDEIAGKTYEGEWREGLQEGRGVTKYAGGDVHEGYYKQGVAHGHGVHKRGHFMASAASVYVGEWANGVKHGYGVMDDIVTGEKYMGEWQNDKKHGRGLLVTSDGMYYEGAYVQGVLSGRGLVIADDGTHYEGELRTAGRPCGRGKLTLSSGDIIEGNFSGSWDEGIRISNATLRFGDKNRRRQLQNRPSGPPSTYEKLSVPADYKWKALFAQCYRVLDGPSLDSRRLWQNVAAAIGSSRRAGRSDSVNDDRLDVIPGFCRDTVDANGYAQLRAYLSRAFDSHHHPLGLLMTDLSEAYVATYGGVRVHPLLLSHAVSELTSMTSRLYEVVRMLFPALPSPGIRLPLSNADTDDEQTAASYSGLLHPLLLPRVHSALFVLYTLHNERDDDIYWKRLVSWNRQPDLILASFLAVDQKFWPKQESSIRDQMLIKPVETLQQLKTTFSPGEKLLVIRRTFRDVTAVVQAQLGVDYRWTMDDLFPVFQFVVVRARVQQLGSELHFIEDFMDPELQNGELGIMFTTVKACYRQILLEKNTIDH